MSGCSLQTKELIVRLDAVTKCSAIIHDDTSFLVYLYGKIRLRFKFTSSRPALSFFDDILIRYYINGEKNPVESLRLLPAVTELLLTLNG